MVGEAQDYRFELSTGILYAAQICIDRVEAGQAPRNLIQLHELGRLLVANGDITKPVQHEDDTADLVPLPSLLKSKRVITATDYEHLDVDGWAMADYIAYGRWLDSVVTPPERAKSQLSEHVIERAQYLGLGPSLNRIKAVRFSSTGNFYRAIRTTPGYERHKYNVLDTTHLADYVEEVFLEQEERRSRGEPTLSLAREIERRALLGQGPSLNIFRGRGVRLKELLADKGYVDVKGMKPEDHVQLGARIMEANGGRGLTKRAVEFLSQRKRAPSHPTILSIFRWADYLNRVQAAFESRQTQTVRAKLPLLKQELQDGTLPHAVIRDAAVSDVLGRRAKWMLVNELLPELSNAQKMVIAKQFSPDTFKGVIRVRANITDAEIEAVAAKLGIAQDLWPERQEYMDYLQVPAELMHECATPARPG